MRIPKTIYTILIKWFSKFLMIVKVKHDVKINKIENFMRTKSCNIFITLIVFQRSPRAIR